MNRFNDSILSSTDSNKNTVSVSQSGNIGGITGTLASFLRPNVATTRNFTDTQSYSSLCPSFLMNDPMVEPIARSENILPKYSPTQSSTTKLPTQSLFHHLSNKNSNPFHNSTLLPIQNQIQKNISEPEVTPFQLLSPPSKISNIPTPTSPSQPISPSLPQANVLANEDAKRIFNLFVRNKIPSFTKSYSQPTIAQPNEPEEIKEIVPQKLHTFCVCRSLISLLGANTLTTIFSSSEEQYIRAPHIDLVERPNLKRKASNNLESSTDSKHICCDDDINFDLTEKDHCNNNSNTSSSSSSSFSSS
eukprot:c21190_g1_i2.p1 GENE.c21190_g1_i2~~c21190_g1_i2.p1  ORF type:complete len:304 (-),score=106.66 c21190_g1_i2:400-1311(-)